MHINKNIPQALYVLQMAHTGYVKIGRSNNVLRRIDELQTGCPHTLKILFVAEGQGFREQEIHRQLNRYRTRGQKGEWFVEDCLGNLPNDLYELIPEKVLENSLWWKSKK